MTFESSEWTELDSGGVPVALRAGREPGPVETGLSFEVDDVDEACAMLREMGATIVEAPRQLPDVDLRIARVGDPEGNCFSVVETG